MAALTGNSIDSSYQGLIKTTDNGAITGTAKAVTDGLGNATNIEISNTATNFVSGTVDFTGSTVTGLPGGAAGLESGTGTDSMQSAASLTTTAADAAGDKSIALGDDAEAANNLSVVIGPEARSTGGTGSNTAIGKNAECLGSGGGKVAIGLNATASGDNSVAVGNSDASGSNAVSLGIVANSTNTYALAMGRSVTASGQSSIAAGYNSSASADDSIAIGNGALAESSNTISIGDNIGGGAGSDNTIKIGADIPTKAFNGDQIIIGNCSTIGGRDNTVIGWDTPQANGDRGVAVGNGADVGSNSVALGETAAATRSNSVAIGRGASASGSGSDGSIAIGSGASAAANKAIAIGVNGTTNSAEGIAIGDNVDISSGADRVIAMGNSINVTSATADDSIVIGTQAASANTKGIALGFDASVTADEAIALGYQVTAAKAQTVSVKALETQTDSTPTAGGIIMSDAGGTERRINIDATGALQIDSTPVGGGGSVSHPARYFGSGNLATTFEGPYTFFSNDILFYAVHLQQGEEVTELAVELGAAFTNTTSIGMALYDSQIGTATVEYVPNNKLLDLGTANPSTIGVKTFTGSTYTATYTGMYFIALGYNGQWDGTFRQTESVQRSYQADTYFIANTTLGFARDFNIAEPIRYGGYNDSMPASFAASQNFSNTSARLALMGKTAQNI